MYIFQHDAHGTLVRGCLDKGCHSFTEAKPSGLFLKGFNGWELKCVTQLREQASCLSQQVWAGASDARRAHQGPQCRHEARIRRSEASGAFDAMQPVQIAECPNRLSQLAHETRFSHARLPLDRDRRSGLLAQRMPDRNKTS